MIITNATDGLWALTSRTRSIPEPSGSIRSHRTMSGSLSLDGRPGLLQRRRRLDPPPLFLEHDAEEVAERRLIVDDEQIHNPILARCERRRLALDWRRHRASR